MGRRGSTSRRERGKMWRLVLSRGDRAVTPLYIFVLYWCISIEMSSMVFQELRKRVCVTVNFALSSGVEGNAADLEQVLAGLLMLISRI